MSRTDVHAPYWVKARDPLWRTNFAETHDHTAGFCDLGEYLAAREWVQTRCRIDLALADANICCGCRMCTGHYDRKLTRGRERSRTRRVLRAAVKTPAADLDTVDIAPTPAAYAVYGSLGQAAADTLDPASDPWRSWTDWTIVLIAPTC